ncbi:M20/M25/M40 family metallo-hydrolase [Vagococcus intermedius]|uniref:Peptidase M20 dimerisation domain-containing protein n=1 Tax=Vagococcus intermedius TaxID=2991418 RepID=A0AAF0IA72_9ENTE|nr:M20/M25/M40 family metallo-hydrolase [Vagococcus intermedius]WEG74207.1 hypothetical protein OL234_04740 [Vagococcus intermedius]WEG76288.1 hypothetical protein OL235_04745 [Vagococcus intermedius]
MITNQLITKTVIAFQNYLYQTAFFLENEQQGLSQKVTSDFIKKELATLNLPIYPSSNTGFFAVLDSGKPGKTIALRSGLDRHLLNDTKVSYIDNDSTLHFENQMKNIATMLATAHILKSWQSDWTGKVIFIFEDSEKNGTGIFKMVQSLSKWPIDAIYGWHLTEKLESGTCSLTPGPVMRGKRRLSVDIENRGQERANALLAGSMIISELLSTCNNEVTHLDITQINTPVVPGTIPRLIRIKGRLSFLNAEEGITSLQQTKEIITKQADKYGCQIKYGPDIETGLNPVINNLKLTNNFKKSLLNLSEDSLAPDQSLNTANSFTRYRELAPSVMSLIGAASLQYEKKSNLMDEKLAKYSLATMLKLTTDFLN